MNANDISVKIFKALGHPVRLEIVKFLLDKPQCVCELNRLFDYSQANLSQHLRILKDAGILESQKVGVEVHYRVRLKGIEKLLVAMELTTAEYFNHIQY
ncbi:metalloregulator ArsR/SmtB family transcription factor [Eubacteriaceae bacterium ES2]|nr:metalloregulator ArsR/SmtB family transcription factor [Eubacteriaceae bacterium ES2]